MSFRKAFLFARIIIGLIFINIHDTEAATLPVEFPLSEKSTETPLYNFRDDPYLLEWTFAIEKTAAPEAAYETLSFEEKILKRWKEKQAHLWDVLPDKAFIINASAYTAAADECGKSDGITASGIKVAEKRTLACPPSYPFGTKIKIEGVGELRCEDRGGAIKGNHFDIYMETKSQAFAFGRQHLLAEIVR